jgi:GR25 family glycosyltransferase involved in LPS biosynthesis
MLEEQKKVSFEIKRLEAVDTRNDKWKNYTNMLNEETKTKLEEAIKNKIRLTHADLTQGAIGCFLSHLEIYKKIVNNHDDKDYILILEDDNVFTDNFEQKIQLAIDRAPKDFDILSFSHSNFKSHKVENNPYYRLAEKYYLLNFEINF